jgi:phosphotransferase system enzyme I (PtsP)
LSDDPVAERKRLQGALDTLRREIDRLIDTADEAASGFADILQVYRMFADDRGWLNRIGEAVDSGLTAEAAVQKVKDDTRVRMSQVPDPVLRERLQDLDDLANRLLGIMAGAAARPELPANAVLVSRTIGPTELLDYDRARIKGLIMEEGSLTMHAAVVAKALDIPVLAQVQGALARIDSMDTVVLDAVAGHVILRPTEDLLDVYSAAAEARQRQKQTYAADRDLPAVTRDGTRVALQINAGFLIDMQALAETGAEGVGLFRTEMPFLALPTLPDVAAQVDLYRQVIAAAKGKPVTFRTLDVGGDKLTSYWGGAAEDNPAMGWRSVRLTLDRPSLMRQQLRALVAATDGAALRIMFPMIASVAEFDAARRILDMEVERHLKGNGRAPARIEVGTMIEVPSLVWQLDELFTRVDFASVGSNDLLQFVFAVDRGNPRVAGRYDVLAPAMLRLLGQISDRAAAAGVELSVCGEMAGRPLEALALIALGYRSLSMAASCIGPVRAMVRSVDLSDVAAVVTGSLALGGASLRSQLKAFAQDHGIVVD